MRYFILIFLCYSTEAFVQNTFILNKDSIPSEGLLLNKNWKWQIGDKPEWANVDFNDSKWEYIDPSKVIPELQYGLYSRPLWLRLKLSTKNKLNHLILSIKQSGATEIYLNNKKIHSFGTIDTLNSKIKSYDPNGSFITLPIDTTENILAIRYYFEEKVRYKSVFDTRFPLFSARVFSEGSAVESDKNKVTFIWEGVNIGVPIILFVVHFILFLFYTPIKANLWYSLWGLCSAISAFMLLEIKIVHSIALKNDYAFYASILGGLGNLSLMYCLLLLLRQFNKKWFISFLVLNIFSFIIFLSESHWDFMLSFVLSILLVLIVLYVAYSAYKQGNIGGKYVMYVMILYLIIWILFIFSFDIINIGWVPDVLFHISFLCLPIMISILLGIDTRNIHANLINSIAEKQQLLENQNQVLEKEVTERTTALNTSLKNLQSTQAQLIHSEKMASLGELTAGIAHEIQNPLNFVNNFSSINSELIDDVSKELQANNMEEVKEILNDIKENSNKINHHGLRASNIVKGMLEHSRTSTGEKTLTDINALCEEYIRLAYQGIRSKDQNFQCEYKTELDPTLPKINGVAQDISRVLLNVLNNAFQACFQQIESRKTESREDYKPCVIIKTKFSASLRLCEISISDNGPGIPSHIKDKIFQPFFTTKPTGQGTGLGLSLSYDIIKVHGGTLTFTSDKNLTTFTITLPYEKI